MLVRSGLHNTTVVSLWLPWTAFSIRLRETGGHFGTKKNIVKDAPSCLSIFLLLNVTEECHLQKYLFKNKYFFCVCVEYHEMECISEELFGRITHVTSKQ